MAETNPDKNNPFKGLFDGTSGMGGLNGIFAMLGQFLNALLGGGLGGLFKGLFGADQASGFSYMNRPDEKPQGPVRRLIQNGQDFVNRQLGPTSAAPRLNIPSADTVQTQNRVSAVLGDAAKIANVSPDLMVGVWGKETQFSRLNKSPTGCLGPWQFTRESMVDRIRVDGAQIAERLRANGRTQEADVITKIHNETNGMSGSAVRSYAARNAGLVDDLRNSPEISTYAAAFHLRANAVALKLDPHNPAHFGMVYAGYNIGAGHAKTILAGGRATGWEVDANKGVAGGANQRASYDNAVHRYLSSSDGQKFAGIARNGGGMVVAGATPHPAERTTSVAKAVDDKPQATPTITGSLSGAAKADSIRPQGQQIALAPSPMGESAPAPDRPRYTPTLNIALTPSGA